MTISPHDAVFARVAKLSKVARKQFSMSFPTPHVVFNLRGKTAGLAYPDRHEIRVNHEMMELNGKDFVKTVIAHELAHLVAFRKYGRNIRPHGIQWQQVMHVFGCSADRTHHYAIASQRQQRRYYYKCGCKGMHTLSCVRHNRSTNGAKYSCRKCKQLLTFVSPIVAKPTAQPKSISTCYQCGAQQEMLTTKSTKGISEILCEQCAAKLPEQPSVSDDTNDDSPPGQLSLF